MCIRDSAMTATIEPIDWPVLMKITDRILKEVKNVNRVCYDMAPKPNADVYKRQGEFFHFYFQFLFGIAFRIVYS